MSERDPVTPPAPFMSRRAVQLLGVFVTLLLSSCAVSSAPTAGPAAAQESKVILYLNGPPKASVDLSMQVTGVQIEREDGTLWPIIRETQEIRSLDVVGLQIRLGEAAVPAGRYTRIELKVGRARLRQEGRVADLSMPAEGLRVPFQFEVVPRQITPLFLTWRVDDSVQGDAFLRSAFTVESRQSELRSLMAYVTNEGANSVSVVDRAQDRVVSVIEVGQGPRGIALHRDGGLIYVVNGRSSNLSVIDGKTNRVLHTVNLEVQGRATDVAITPDGRTLYVANTGLNTVSAIDANSFQTQATIRVGNEPRGVVVNPRGDRLYVANSLENTLSVVDTIRQQVVATAVVESRPYALAFDEVGERLFVGHLGSANLLVLSPATLRPLRTIFVGMGTVAVLPDQSPNRVFVAQQAANHVLVFDTQLGVEVGRLAPAPGPRNLTLDPERGKVFVVNRSANAVGVYDRASRHREATIQVGAQLYGIALVR